ncbi:hypothetical protein RQP54_17420 [Curvibacter sp. APW13]|uniref:hypothetical protein n=1 Tax=Curvibacter sp. APW13 TaxID=3077236 RepID=UPI0028DE61FA|nr:hypothetical protein [Curvibacter sp. APW13]MDT8992655.1 hypothetical protein [Curvibacter sp. APW13]
MKKSSTAADLFRQIRDSAGSGYLNRAHQRSFSLNVFQMNALELIEATQRVKDPDQGIVLMMEKNREAGRQAHRELNRHVHNFASSAMTLVEHTRVFMRKHYAETDLYATYEKQVTATFAQSPVAQFVQGLRNYMLHRGLPSSSMFMKFATDPGATDGSGTAEAGVHYDTASLLDWDGWKPVARTYLEQAGEHLDLHESAQEYLTLVNQFHGWLDASLAAHHRSDLQELDQLQAQLQAISPTRELISAATVEALDAAIVEPFEFTLIQTTELIQISSGLREKIRELHFPQAHQGFPTERPTTTITDRELAGPITFWGQEASGETAFMFIHHEGRSYGLSEGDYESLEGLIDTVMRSTWARASLSRKFVEKSFWDWARQRFGAEGPPFHEALISAARECVTKVEVWAPIANMEVEQGFDFGPVRIESITAGVMESFRSRVSSIRTEHAQEVSQLFEELKRELQGFAAVVLSMKAEPAVAQERALRIAQDAVGLLRFFAPAAPRSYLFNPVALMGAEYLPTSKLIVLGEGSFLLNQGILPKQVGHWRLPMQQISELKSGLLDTAASLVMPEGLSEFALAVRASLLTYSKGTTLVDPLDRLRNSLSAIEGVLLRHDMEPRAHSVANRMSFLLARRGADREAIKQIVQKVYWLRGVPKLMEQGRREDELITVFTSYAYDVLRLALGNTPTFSSRVQFVIEIDRVGLSTN